MSPRASAERWLTARWYGRGPVWWLVPLTLVFAVLLALRALLHRLGWQRPQSVGRPVLVVGNLTAGGTGKTPFVLWLCAALRARGRRPGIISRGHGGSGDGAVRTVSPVARASEVGDEPLLLARRSGVPVVIGADRVAAARHLIAAHPEVDVIVADDGLQHRRLARHLEVVMLDGERGLGNRWWLPAGPLREPAGRLHRVDLVVATGRTCADHVDAPVMRLDLGAAQRLSDGQERPLSEFRGTTVTAVAGIGNPGRFFAALEAEGLEVEAHALGDHARFAPETFIAGDRMVLMTEKDACRLGAHSDERLWLVPVAARFQPHDEAWILDTVERALVRAQEAS